MQYDDRWIGATLGATRDLTPGLREFILLPEGGAQAYPTGAHLRIRLDIAGRSAVRHYSLIGAAPRDGAFRIAVQRDDAGRGGSRAMWALRRGAPGRRRAARRPAWSSRPSAHPAMRRRATSPFGFPVWGARCLSRPMSACLKHWRRRGLACCRIADGASAAFARWRCWPWMASLITATSSSRTASMPRIGASAPASRAWRAAASPLIRPGAAMRP